MGGLRCLIVIFIFLPAGHNQSYYTFLIIIIIAIADCHLFIQDSVQPWWITNLIWSTAACIKKWNPNFEVASSVEKQVLSYLFQSLSLSLI